MKLLKRLSKWTNVHKHISARVFISSFFALLLISMVLIGMYTVFNLEALNRIVLERGMVSVNAYAEQIDTAIRKVSQTHTLLFSSEYIYAYLNKNTNGMPSLQWFETYNAAQKTLRLCGRGQVELIMGMLLYKNSQEFIQYGSFYGLLRSHELFSTQKNGLIIQNGKAFFISSSTLNSGSKSFLVSQLYDSVFDHIAESLLTPDSSFIILDKMNEVFRQYASDGIDSTVVSSALLNEPNDMDKENQKWLFLRAKPSEFGLSYVMALPQSSRLDIWLEASPWLFPVLLFSLIAALLLSYGISRHLASGFRIMQENMRFVEQNEYDKVGLINSRDEFYEMSRAFARMAHNVSSLISEIKERERKEHNLQIQVLRAQVSPHFLYNALNSMRNLAMIQGMHHIERMALSLIKLLRAALGNEGLLVSLTKELEYIDNYWEICQYQYLDDIKLQIRVNTEAQDCLTPQMILQPIVENSIIHGIRKNNRPGIIRITAEKRESTIFIRIIDNGQGMSDKQISQLMQLEANTDKMRFSGIGIYNVQKRIRMRFGEKFGLTIHSRVGYYTSVEILLPYLEMETQIEKDSVG